MTLGRSVLLIAGTLVLPSLVLPSLVLAAVASPYCAWFRLFIGANLILSSLTGFCPTAVAFK